MRVRTRAEIEAQARFHADMEDGGTGFVQNDPLHVEYDQSIADLWNLLVAADPERYSTTTTIASTAGTTSHELPEDFMALVAVWRLEGTRRYWVERFGELDRTVGQVHPGDALLDQGPAVRVVGQGSTGADTRLEFDYAPGGGRTYEVRYVIAPPFSENDDDAFDGVAGWEQWVVYDLAIKMRQREDGDVQVLMLERQRIESRIQAMAEQRFIGRAHYVKDTRRSSRLRL